MSVESAKRVLICDDERHIARLLESNLKREGFSVTCVYDGNSAIELLEAAEASGQVPYEKVFLDSALPDMDGLGVLTWIRTHDWSKQTWVAMMVAQGHDISAWEQSPYRADIYSPKSVAPRDLF